MWARRLVVVVRRRPRAHPTTSRLTSPSPRLLSTNNNSNGNPSRSSGSLWQSLKAPALFGAGLYLGLVAFGEHQETKEGSAYFAGLRDMFWGGEGGESNASDNSDADASASEKGER